MSNTPLPPIVERADEHYHGEGLADAVHAHAAAVSAADNAALREFVQHVRHSGDTRLASMAIAVLAALGDKTPNDRGNRQ